MMDNVINNNHFFLPNSIEGSVLHTTGIYLNKAHAADSAALDPTFETNMAFLLFICLMGIIVFVQCFIDVRNGRKYQKRNVRGPKHY